jgi:hypothetical protein
MCMSLFVARQRSVKNFPAAMHTHATIEELLEASISTRSVLYQRKVGNQFFTELLVYGHDLVVRSHLVKRDETFYYTAYPLYRGTR